MTPCWGRLRTVTGGRGNTKAWLLRPNSGPLWKTSQASEPPTPSTLRSPGVSVGLHHSPTSPSARPCFPPPSSLQVLAPQPPAPGNLWRMIPVSPPVPGHPDCKKQPPPPAGEWRTEDSLDRAWPSVSGGEAGVCIPAQRRWLCARPHSPEVAPRATWEAGGGASGRALSPS